MISSKLSLLLPFSILISFSLSSQNIIDNNKDKPATSDWQIYKEMNGVLIYYKYQECNLPEQGLYQEFVLLKAVNSTDVKLKVEWDIELWYDEKCITCGNPDNEYHHIIELEAGESTEGNCAINSKQTLKIFKKFLNRQNIPELTKFEMKNITITPNTIQK